MPKLIAVILLLAINVQAKDAYIYQGKPVTKLKAMKILLRTDNKASVARCYPVEMSEKGSIRKVKGKR